MPKLDIRPQGRSAMGPHSCSVRGKRCENINMPTFGELSQSSRDFFVSDSDSKEFRDDRLKSPKRGILNFWAKFWRFSELFATFFRVGRSQPIGARKLLSAQSFSRINTNQWHLPKILYLQKWFSRVTNFLNGST